MKTYRSRHCSFSAPDDWVEEPPFGFCEDSQREGRMSAQVLERWLESPAEARVLISARLELLPQMLSEFKLLEEPGPAAGQPSGQTFRYRYRDENDVPLIQRLVIRSQGPVVCEFTLSCLDEPEPPRDDLLDKMAATFALNELPHLASCRSAEVLAIAPRPADAPPLGPCTELPGLCISIPVPDRWRLTDERSSAVLDDGQSQIRVSRELRYGGDSDVWFTTRQHHVQDSGGRLAASQRGELEDGRSFAALLYEEGGTVSTWRTEASSCFLEALLEGPQPLVWTVTGNQYAVNQARPMLEQLIAATTWLVSSRWETDVPEPWVDLVLRGAWKPMDTGLYVNTAQGFSLVSLSEQQVPAPVGLGKNEEAMVNSLRNGFAEVYEERHAQADHDGLPSLSYAGDGTNEDNVPVAIRAMWIETPKALYTIFIQSTDSAVATTLFDETRNGLRIKETN